MKSVRLKGMEVHINNEVVLVLAEYRLNNLNILFIYTGIEQVRNWLFLNLGQGFHCQSNTLQKTQGTD